MAIKSAIFILETDQKGGAEGLINDQRLKE